MNEHDMEKAIDYTVNLAKEIKGDKDLSLSFPSETLSHIFLSNLAVTFIQEGLPIKSNLKLEIIIPNFTMDEDDMLIDDDEEDWDYDSLYDDGD
jgi:hypothetical protein